MNLMLTTAVYPWLSCVKNILDVCTEPISAGARQVPGLSVGGERLLHRGQPVHATDIQSAPKLFSAWVKSIPKCV